MRLRQTAYNSSLERYRLFLVLFLLLVSGSNAFAFRVRGSRGVMPEEYKQNSKPADYYVCEFGLLGGGSYYVGDATAHIFQHVRPAAGLLFRYNHTRRWSFTAKATYSDLRFSYATQQTEPLHDSEAFVAEHLSGRNMLVATDITAEYNFFELARGWVNRDTRPFSPYIFVGLGISWQQYGPTPVTGYLPFGIGFKWLMHPRASMFLAWQHQLQFNDKLEGVDQLNDFWDMNGSNFFKNDIFSTFTLGLTVNFATRKRKCLRCGE